MKYLWLAVAIFLACAPVQARIVISTKKMTDRQVVLTDQLTDAGDPKAIDQAGQLLARADHMGNSPDRDQLIRQGLTTLGAFRYKPAEKMILGLLSNRQMSDEIRDAALIALAGLHDPGTIPRLKTEAASLDHSELARCEAWRALLDMGEAIGREKLLEEYKSRYTIAHPSTGRGVRDVLPKMNDAELIKSLSDFANDPAMKEHKSFVNDMVKQMKLNSEVDKLLKIAQSTKVGAAGQRFPAIDAIGEFGTPEMIPDLLKLKAFDGQSATVMQTESVQVNGAKAIGRIQQRYCEELQKRGKPFVTDAEARIRAYQMAGSKP